MMTLQQFYLAKIAEEASEIAQIALKASQFGLTERYPQDPKNNAERLCAELTDLQAMVLRLVDTSPAGEFWFDIGSLDHVAIARKLQKVDHYLAYSQSLGMVEASPVGVTGTP